MTELIGQPVLALLWRPAGSPLHILAAALLLAALAVFVCVRTFPLRPLAGALLLAMRLVIIAALAILLMGPSRIEQQSQAPLRPRLAVLLDTSASMQTDDCSGRSRIAAASDWLTEDRLDALARDFDLQLQGFADESAPLSPQLLHEAPEQVAVGKASHIADSVARVLHRMANQQSLPGFSAASSASPAALLVLSDGRDSNDASLQPAALLAQNRDIVTHTVSFGGSNLQRDIALLALPMQEYLLSGEPGQVMVKLYQAGLARTRTTLHVQHRAGSAAAAGPEVTRPVNFTGDRLQTITRPVQHDEPGLYEYRFRVAPVEGERETANNEQTVFVQVIKRRIRVLVLEGEPFWDTKFLAQSLRKDERVELTQVSQLSPQRQEKLITRVESASAGVPESLEALSDYDVIVLGRTVEQVLSAQVLSALPRFVAEHGGHLVLARGQPYDPRTAQGRAAQQALGVLEPVVWSDQVARDQSLRPTPAGRMAPWFSMMGATSDIDAALARLPGLSTMQVVAEEKPAAIVLARAAPAGSAGGIGGEAGAAALVSMTYGRGKVVAITGEGLWRWALLPPDLHDLADFYDAFWSNLVRWLALGGQFQPGTEASLRLAHTSVRLGDPLIVDVTARSEPPAGRQPTLTLIDPEGAAREMAMQSLPGSGLRLRTTLEPGQTGVYRVLLDTPWLEPQQQERRFSVYDVDLERLHTSANPLGLRMLAEVSGGTFFAPDEFDRFHASLRRLRASMLVPGRAEFIWDQGWILALLLVWAGLEWIIRKLLGLL